MKYIIEDNDKRRNLSELNIGDVFTINGDGKFVMARPHPSLDVSVYPNTDYKEDLKYIYVLLPNFILHGTNEDMRVTYISKFKVDGSGE